MFGSNCQHGSAGLLERLLVLLVGLIAVVVAIGVLVELLTPLLPWIGFGVLVAAAVRFWVTRDGGW